MGGHRDGSDDATPPLHTQGMGISLLNKRKGQLTGSETGDMGVVIEADVPLSQMFGFSTDLRSGTQVSGLAFEAVYRHATSRCFFSCLRRARGTKAHAEILHLLLRLVLTFPFYREFTMEYKAHMPVPGDVRKVCGRHCCALACSCLKHSSLPLFRISRRSTRPNDLRISRSNALQ